MQTALEKMRSILDSTKLIAITGIVYLISQIGISMIIHPIVSSVARLQTTVSSDVVLSIINEWLKTGDVQYYLRHFYLDFAHPFWYSLFLASAISRIFNVISIQNKYNFLLLLPFVAGLLDLIENVLHLIFIADTANITPAMTFMSGTASMTKWTLAGMCTGFVTIFVITRIWRKIFQSK
jgi:hypothetical protein